MTQTSSGPEATAAKIAQLEAEALAFDNVRDALDHAEQEIVLLRDALRRIADSGGTQHRSRWRDLRPFDVRREGTVMSAATLYRRKPDTVEAMQWNPSDAEAMQAALTWLRESGEVFKTVGRQVWVEYGERGEQFVVHPGDYLIRRIEGRRYFYAESESKFKETRELVA